MPAYTLTPPSAGLGVGGRVIAGVLVAALLTALTPPLGASAATIAPPAPVQDVPYKPSTFVAGTGTTENSKDLRYRLLAEAREKVYTPRTAPQPIAPPKAPTRGLAGGPLGLVMLAPVIVNGGLQIAAISSEFGGAGETAEEIICNGIGSTAGNLFLESLYGAVSCVAPVTVPNVDIATGFHPVTVGNMTLQLIRTEDESPGFISPSACYMWTAYSGADEVSIGYVSSTGVWTSSGGSSIGTSGSNRCTGAQRRWIGTVAHSAAQDGVWPHLLVRHRPAGAPAGQYTYLRTDQPVATDPQRQARCRIEWSDGSTSVADGVTYTESGGLPVSSASLGCEEAFVSAPGDPTKFPERILIESEQGGSITEIADIEVPSEASPSKPSEGLRLLKTVGTTLQSCMTWDADCADWWAESDEGTNTDVYRCTFGGEVIDLAECGVYRRSFTDPNQVRLVDPETGEEVPWGTTPNNNTTNPGAGPTPGDACMAAWPSSPNPIDWVLHPVKCALVWAFVPRAQKVTETQDRVDQAWRDSSPGKLSATITGISPLLSELDAGSCGGLILPVPSVGAGWAPTIENRAFLPACPGDFFAPWAPLFYWLITGGLVVAGFFMVKRWLDRFVGF